MKLDVKSQNHFLEFVKSVLVEVNLLVAILLIVYHLLQTHLHHFVIEYKKKYLVKHKDVYIRQCFALASILFIRKAAFNAPLKMS